MENYFSIQRVASSSIAEDKRILISPPISTTDRDFLIRPLDFISTDAIYRSYRHFLSPAERRDYVT